MFSDLVKGIIAEVTRVLLLTMVKLDLLMDIQEVLVPHLIVVFLCQED